MDQVKSKPINAQECCGICHGKGVFTAKNYKPNEKAEEELPCPLCSPFAPLGARDRRFMLGVLLLIAFLLVLYKGCEAIFMGGRP